MAGEDQVPESNGLALLPDYDYKKLYVISTGKGPGDHWPARTGKMYSFHRQQQQSVQPEAPQPFHDRRLEIPF